ncbi:CD225/dispanin family protein [Rhodococcus artemisiae]|uniref:CD225/dispanin family protein n=1 Tax=Rhodococcus artemisiae TaxID=714159 RepID=A0ABU7LA06_9NOCA|nr:CD225/dispanin family protein [Rhodococcus artemisiae]MEE2058382.1 CD225/dispanin family protein [Rhodococcus artemisiae]
MTQQFQQHGFQHGAAPEYSRPPLPAQNTGWAVAAMLFFWPLAFSAFSNSAKVFPLWTMGDYEGAHRASAQAKKLGKISLMIWVVFMVLLVVLYVVIFAVAMASVEAVTDYPSYR